jgi:quercetin dioxygenase-like cupin family protein
MTALNKDMPVFPGRQGVNECNPIHDPSANVVEEWTFDPGVQFTGHAHDVSEITYIIKGKMRLKEGDKEFLLEQGCYYYTPAGTIHQITEIIERTTILIVGTPPTKTVNHTRSYH